MFSLCCRCGRMHRHLGSSSTPETSSHRRGQSTCVVLSYNLHVDFAESVEVLYCFFLLATMLLH